jgi:hypothetical protein
MRPDAQSRTELNRDVEKEGKKAFKEIKPFADLQQRK